MEISTSNISSIEQSKLPEQQSKSYTGRLWTNYTNRLSGTNPTRFSPINALFKAVVAITTFAPYIIATVATILADVVVAIKNGFNALIGRSVKEEEPIELNESEISADFFAENKGAIIVGTAVVALAIIGYVKHEAIMNQLSVFKDTVMGYFSAPVPVPVPVPVTEPVPPSGFLSYFR